VRALTDYETTCASPAAGDPDGIDIEVSDLRQRLEGREPPLLLDVRTAQEWKICHLPGASLIPVQELEQRLGELRPDREIVVYCHVGMRGAMAAGLLRRHGYTRVRNLAGGIDAWAATIDPEMPRY
jgi:adenylyltransferase/sulfurtransferase